MLLALPAVVCAGVSTALAVALLRSTLGLDADFDARLPRLRGTTAPGRRSGRVDLPAPGITATGETAPTAAFFTTTSVDALPSLSALDLDLKLSASF